jgi:hypothetical protein
MEAACAGRSNRLWTKYRQQVHWLLPPLRDVTELGQFSALISRWGKFIRELPTLAAAGRREKPLVKCIRANLMLGWLSRQCACRIVLVVRHPGAVIESELRGHWDANAALVRFRDDEGLRAMTGNRYERLLGRRLSTVEALAARWVIENQLAIEQAPENGVTVVYYEHLQSKPEHEWRRVCRALDLPNVPSSTVLARPSQQAARKMSDSGASRSSEPGWASRLTQDQAGSIQRVLDDVGFAIYSIDRLMPWGAPETTPLLTEARLRS